MGIADQNYRECVTAHDDSLWKAVREYNWAAVHSVSVLFWYDNDGEVLLRTITRLLGSRRTKEDRWAIEISVWRVLEAKQSSGAKVLLGFVDECGQPVGKVPLDRSLIVGTERNKHYILRRPL